MTSPDPDELARRAQRRAFIRTHHPDVGGDADLFAEGLAGFVGRVPPPSPPPARPNVTAFRRRTVGRSVRRTMRDLRRRIAGLPPRRLL